MFSSGVKHTLKWVCACDTQGKLFTLTDISGYLHMGNAEQMLLKLTAET